jgi:hypothetical protein
MKKQNTIDELTGRDYVSESSHRVYRTAKGAETSKFCRRMHVLEKTAVAGLIASGIGLVGLIGSQVLPIASQYTQRVSQHIENQTKDRPVASVQYVPSQDRTGIRLYNSETGEYVK